MSKYTVNKYIRRLKAYTFPEDYYDYVIKSNLDSNLRRKEMDYEAYNRLVILNTPSENYLFDGKFIYYDSLKELNYNINVWIQIFALKAKYMTDNSLIEEYYNKILANINKEIDFFAKMCKKKYKYNAAITPNTLVGAYINILENRKWKIMFNLREILREKFDLYYDKYENDVLELLEIYQNKILSIEEESEELYNQFIEEAYKILSKPKKLIKEGNVNNGN